MRAKSWPHGISTPAVGDRFRVGDATVTVTGAWRRGLPDGRTVVVAEDANGEEVELRFFDDKDWEDDV